MTNLFPIMDTFWASDPIGKLIVVILVGASVAVWTIMFAKHAELRQANAELRQEVAELKDRLKHLEESRLARDIADAAKGAPGTFTTIEGNKVTTLRPPRQSRRKDGQ